MAVRRGHLREILRRPADSALLGAATVGLVAFGAGALAAAGPSALAGLLAAGAVGSATLRVMAPGAPLGALSLCLLGAEYAAVTSRVEPVTAVAGAVVVSCLLWVAHAGFSLAEAAGRGAAIDPELVRRWAAQTGGILIAGAVFATAAAAAGFAVAPGSTARLVGAACALAVALLPAAVSFRLRARSGHRDGATF